MKKYLLKVLMWAVIIIVTFKVTEGFFWLMNLQNTLANILGLLGIVAVVTTIVIFTIDTIKDSIEKFKNKRGKDTIYFADLRS